MADRDQGGCPSADQTSLVPDQGWHCAHWYYVFDRRELAGLEADDLREGRSQFVEILDPTGPLATQRMQTWIVNGHKADFGALLMDPDPRRIDRVHQRLMASRLGAALRPTFSLVSLTEVSEYVPSVEQYAERLKRDGESETSDAYRAKLKAYERRLPVIRRQRLEPELPAWPATCFYPMNKRREADANWFLLPFSERNRLMAQHAQSGMEFAGKVIQLVTASIGLDDWEWGVTLWARNPQFLKEIVYRMRYDEASARYAAFGPFYSGFVATPDKILDHCGIASQESQPNAQTPEP